MKYESNILERLIKTYGVVGNPKYVSEIIKQFIIQGKECYPNLFTYQSDWLSHIDEFGLNPTYTVSYTGQSIYAPNTLERPVKSAILKGQTLVNKMNNATYRTGINVDIKPNDNNEFINTDNGGDGYNILPLQSSVFEPNKIYTIILFLDEIGDGGLDKEQLFVGKGTMLNIGVNKTLYTTSSSVDDTDYSHNTQISNSFKARYMIIEGDYTNVDIPYFEGMQSVKMPVLTTSNEDGTKTNILTVNEDVELGSVGEVKDELNLLTGQLTQRTETRAYQEGDESNSEALTDMTNTRYKLPKEVIKTVDLTILDQNEQSVDHLKSFNGGTHVYTSSLEGSLVPSVDISVVTNLEETLMMCSTEGNTI